MDSQQQSEMLKAFLANQKYTDQGASDILIEREAEQQQRMKDAYAQLGRSQNISDYMEVETNIKPGELDQKTQPHSKLQGYDHSLEMPRIRCGEDGADVLADGVKIPEPEPEGLRLCPNGLPSIEKDPMDISEDVPDFGIDWDSIGNQLGL